ncbi:hypothetical protein SCHPADRAFT_848554 [Schizopora paradoxa]|uniref:RBR-type E3 ubiquitin transferase n=1 Tax=Schizopora paradoxa TaxID=27342 RepID=A0A0H2S307_9AGAM|nr:hypothetical protein SCHPADRAFT_848554 [Schizopora paradoxa]
MGGWKHQRRKRQLEKARKLSESACSEAPLEAGDIEVPKASLPAGRDIEHDTLGFQEDKSYSEECAVNCISLAGNQSTAVDTRDVCLNFNKGRCLYGWRCMRRHIYVSDTVLRDVESGTMCRYGSRKSCLYKGCLRLHSDEQTAETSAFGLPNEVNCKGKASGLPRTGQDTHEKDSLTNHSLFCDESTGTRAVVRLPVLRKPHTVNRKSQAAVPIATSPESVSTEDYAGCDFDERQSCFPLPFDGANAESTSAVVHLRNTSVDERNKTCENNQGGTNVTKCMYCVLGLCDGQRCRVQSSVSTTVPEKVSNTDERKDHERERLRQELIVKLFSRMKVSVGPGMQISEIAAADESSSIIIANLPSFVAEDGIRNICIRFGTVNSVRMIGRDRIKTSDDPLSAKVDFENISQAKKATKKLNGAKRFFSVLRVYNCLPGWGEDPAVGLLSNSLVRIDIPAPGRTVFLGYSSVTEAQLAIATMHGTSVKGKIVTASIYEGLPRIGESTVKLECLPDDIREEEIRSFSRSNGQILFGRTVYNSISAATSELRPYFEEHGEIIKFDFPSSTSPKDGRLNGLLQFSSPDAASAACSFLNGRRFACIGNEKLYVTHLHAISYVVTPPIFVAIRSSIYFLQDVARWHNVQLLVSSKDDIGRTRIKLLGGGSLNVLKRVKDPVEHLLAGQKVQMQSGPVWDVFFGSRVGTEFLCDVARYTGSYIRADRYKGYITVWGSSRACAQASRNIIDKAVELQSTRTFSIPFVPGMVSKLLSKDFLAIQDMLGEHNVELDLSMRCLRIRGTQLQYRSATALLQGRRAFAYHGDGPLVLTDEVCPICLSPVIEPVTLECAHKTCKSCLARYVSSSVTHRSFPIKCLGDDASCTELIPASLCRRIVPPDEFIKVVEASFHSYTAARPHEFRRCPSENCAQVYKLQNESDSRSLQCPSCLVRVCPYCHEEEHPGYQCVGMVKEDERLYKQWKDEHDVHPCPTCHADIEKVAGCNHMTCSQCKTHICWICFATFADGSDVYKHMGNIHGGIG